MSGCGKTKGTNKATNIFVNLPVNNLSKSLEFLLGPQPGQASKEFANPEPYLCCLPKYRVSLPVCPSSRWNRRKIKDAKNNSISRALLSRPNINPCSCFSGLLPLSSIVD
jgi:hypothetical protein